MKQLLITVFTVFLLSCELPDSGRMAVINFNFNQPDIIKDSLSSQDQDVPDRILPGETETVIAIMYPSFSDDPLYDSDNIESYVPSYDELNQILTKADTRTLYMNFDSGISSGSLENIEPGEYSFAVFTFDSPVTNLDEEYWMEMFNLEVMTWRVKKNIEITAGINLVDLPLKLNYGRYYTANSPVYLSESSEFVEKATYLDETIFASITGVPLGECHVIYNPLYVLPGGVIVSLYSEDGYLLDYTPNTDDPTAFYLSLESESEDDIYIISARRVYTLSGDPISMSLYSFLDNSPDPSKIVLEIKTELIDQ